MKKGNGRDCKEFVLNLVLIRKERAKSAVVINHRGPVLIFIKTLINSRLKPYKRRKEDEEGINDSISNLPSTMLYNVPIEMRFGRIRLILDNFPHDFGNGEHGPAELHVQRV